jgi:hypothetical protein
MSDVRKSDFGLAGQIEPRVAIANSLRMLHTEKLAFLPNPWRFLLEAPSAASRIVIVAKNRVFQQYRAGAEINKPLLMTETPLTTLSHPLICWLSVPANKKSSLVPGFSVLIRC